MLGGRPMLTLAGSECPEDTDMEVAVPGSPVRSGGPSRGGSWEMSAYRINRVLPLREGEMYLRC